MCLALDLEDSNFLASCPTLPAGNFSRSILESLVVLQTISSSLRKKTNKICLCVVFLLFLVGTLPDWSGLVQHYTIHLHSYLLACNLLTGQSLLLLHLTEVYRILWICSKWPPRTNLLGGKHQDTYWSIPKSPDQATTFLHFLASDNIASSQSNIFSHLIFHFRNLWYKLSFTVQFIFGPSIYAIYIGCISCIWLVDGWINCGLCITTSSSCSWSELVSFCSLVSSGRTYSIVCCSHLALFFSFWHLETLVSTLAVLFKHIQSDASCKVAL